MPIKTITNPGVTSATLDQFGRPGLPTRLTVVPVFKDDSSEASLNRQSDKTDRPFHVRARLAKSLKSASQIIVQLTQKPVAPISLLEKERRTK
jgi:hypothetical protein